VEKIGVRVFVGAFNLKLKKPWKNGGFAGFQVKGNPFARG
jgi:hypothetical protein